MQNFSLTYILFGVLPCIVPQIFLYSANRVKIEDKMPNTFYCLYIYQLKKYDKLSPKYQFYIQNVKTFFPAEKENSHDFILSSKLYEMATKRESRSI